MHYKSLLKGIGLTILFSLVKSEDCDTLQEKHDSIKTCYSNENNVPYYLTIEDNFDNNVLKDVTKLTSLKELEIYNTLNVTADYSILKKLKKLTTLTYEGELNDATLKSISKISSVTNLNVQSSVSGNVNLKSLKNLKLKKLTVGCHNHEVEDKNYLVKKTLNNFASTLKDLTIVDCLIDKKEDFTSLTKVTTFNADGWIDKNLFKKVAAMPSVKIINLYFQKLDVEPSDIYTIDITDFKSASKLTELYLSSAYSRYRDHTRIKYDTLKGLKKLKKLHLDHIALDQKNIDEISNIKTIESLNFEGCPLLSEGEVLPTYDSLLKRKSTLKYLSYSFPKKSVYTSDIFEEVPEFIYSLTNLKNLTLHNTYITTLSDKIVNLKKLEHLDLSNNNLESLPDNLDQLKKLKYLDLNNNRSLKGKSLNNNKLEYCNYYRTDICKDQDVKCFKNYEHNIELCSSGCNQFEEFLASTQSSTDFDNYFCRNNDDGQIEYLIIDDNEINEEGIEKLLSFKDTLTQLDLYWNGSSKTLSTISELTNIDDITIYFNATTLDLTPINNLTKIKTLLLYNSNAENCELKEGFIENLTDLDILRISKINLSQALVNEIGKLTVLENLTILEGGYPSDIDYSSWENLEKMVYFYIEGLGADQNPLTEIPKSFYTFKNLNRFSIADQKIETIDSALAEFKKLDYLNLENNNLSSLPAFLNTMESLRTVYFEGNPNLKGPIVDNDNVSLCVYDYTNKNLCLPRENVKCIESYTMKPDFPLCN